ncbi:Phenylalanine--tRNA ligase beta subunit [Phycisphaerae bacterium RAS1]|nr:Phenylalanine--tRNA ligase beta subunit [Phycisphaerae bacterium RAS1]
MPVIDMSLSLLMQHVRRDSDVALSEEDLISRLPQMGCAVEGVAQTREYLCEPCGKVFDRTAAQGAPLSCTHCGTDFRTTPAALRDLGENKVIRLELLAVRPDIFDPGGMSRLIRAYLGIETGMRHPAVGRSEISVVVDPALGQDGSYRPFIACAVLRNVQLDHESIKVLMNMQEDLHWALGRNRKLASIGVYDLDTLKGTQFRYDAVAPDALRFVPLGFSPTQPDAAITPADILTRHKTGQEFAHLLAGFTAYPLLRDEAGTVLSMPPIINSESTRVTRKSHNLFIDVTGTSQRAVERALNIVVSNLKELLPATLIEGVTIQAASRTRITPALDPVRMELRTAQASDIIGVKLNHHELWELLERMGHGIEGATHDNTRLAVLVPAFRNDVMHPVDLIEDAAIAYGYNRLEPALVPTFSVGAPREIEERSVLVRRVFTGLGFHQVMTLVLSNEKQAFERWKLPVDERAVKIENPISVEQTICRVSLLPGLLETLSINKQYELPQQIFEVGDCCFVDPASETGAREERIVAAAMISTHAGFADIRAVADAFAHEMGAACAIRPTEHPSFIPGRAAALHDPAGNAIGVMGELHPEVIEAHGLKHAVAVMEMRL